MGWLDSQMETRARLDADLTERAYAELASSVSGPRTVPRFTVNDMEQADGAIKACLKYEGIEPGSAPQDVEDVNQRIEWICRPSGTLFRTVRLDGDWYRRAFGAMLARLETGETVALLPRGVRGYYYLEPGSGRKVVVNARVASQIAPEAIFFYKPLPTRALRVRDLGAFIFRVFSRTDYLLVFFAALAAALIGLAPAWANQVAFSEVAPSGKANLILPIAALLLGVVISSALIGIVRNFIMSRVSIKLDIASEAATFSRLLMLPTTFFKQYSSGDLASRISNVKLLSQTTATVLLGAGLTAFLSLVYILQIGAFAPVLMLPALVIVLVEGSFMAVVTSLNARYERLTMESSAKLSGTVTALLNGVQKIKLAGAEDRAFAKWARGYSDYARVAYNRPAILRALTPIITVMSMLGTLLVYYLAGTAQVSIANYMAFNVAFGQTLGALLSFAAMAGQIAQIRPMLEMVSPILEAEPEVSDDRPGVDDLNGSIDISGVSFRYNEESPYVLNDLSFKVRPGEYVAIVGRSGCGKSTIVRLLLGFEEPELGTIFYGEHDVQKVDLRSLRQHIGVVMQDGKLFMGDIASNITISTPDATLDDAWAAAELAGVAEDIRKMPMGMQTLVTEGSGGVSGGQRQRLMIARAICGQKRILIFDEATSALDNVTQKHVSDSLDSLKCTRVVVAHRLSTVRHCDRILVVDNGSIAEEGTYEELIARDGIFAELVAKQRLDRV